MTLLRRAPREVYRVYGEDEFFASATQDHQHNVAEHPDGEGRQLQRFVGATVLLVVMGVVGAMVAITSISSVAGARRRGVGRLSAANGSPVARGDRVVPVHTNSPMPSTPGQPVDRSGVAHYAGGRAHRVTAGGLSSVTRRRGGDRPRVAVLRAMNISGSAHAVQAVGAGVPVSVADSGTGTSAAAPAPIQAEFGFER